MKLLIIYLIFIGLIIESVYSSTHEDSSEKAPVGILESMMNDIIQINQLKNVLKIKNTKRFKSTGQSRKLGGLDLDFNFNNLNDPDAIFQKISKSKQNYECWLISQNSKVG